MAIALASTTARDRIAAVIARIGREPGGTVFALREGTPRAWLASLTNQVVEHDLKAAVERAFGLADRLVLLNPALSRTVTVGWWRSPEGDLYCDTGLSIERQGVALAVASAFRQAAVADATSDPVRIVSVVGAYTRS